MTHSPEHLFEKPTLLSAFFSVLLFWAISWALLGARQKIGALFWALKRVHLLSRALFWVGLLARALFWGLFKGLSVHQNLNAIKPHAQADNAQFIQIVEKHTEQKYKNVTPPQFLHGVQQYGNSSNILRVALGCQEVAFYGRTQSKSTQTKKMSKYPRNLANLANWLFPQPNSPGGRLHQGETVGIDEEDQEAEKELVLEEGGHLQGPLQDQEEQQDTDWRGKLSIQFKGSKFIPTQRV